MNNNDDEYLSKVDNCLDSILDKNKHFGLYVPSGVTTINEFCCSCSNITKVVLPDSLKTIKRGAFFSCYLLNNVVIPNGTTIIEQEAFRNCPQLEEVFIPKSVKIIGDYAFEGSNSLVVIYQGTKEDFDKIIINKDKNKLLFDSINFATDYDYFDRDYLKDILIKKPTLDYDNNNYFTTRLRLYNMSDSLYKGLMCGDYLNPITLLNCARISNLDYSNLFPSKKGKPFFIGNPFSYNHLKEKIAQIKVVGKRKINGKKPIIFVDVTIKTNKDNNYHSIDLAYSNTYTNHIAIKDFKMIDYLIENFMPIPYGKLNLNIKLSFDEKLSKLYKNTPLQQILGESLSFISCSDKPDSLQNDSYFENIVATEKSRLINDNGLLTIFCNISTLVKIVLAYSCHITVPTSCSLIPE